MNAQNLRIDGSNDLMFEKDELKIICQIADSNHSILASKPKRQLQTDLIKELKYLHSLLQSASQSDSIFIQSKTPEFSQKCPNSFSRCHENISIICRAIESQYLQKNSESLIQCLVSCITVDLLRILEWNAVTMSSDTFHSVFLSVFDSLRFLSEPGSIYFSYSFYVLQSIATSEFPLLVFDFDAERCAQIIFNIFCIILDTISDNHSATILDYCEEVLEKLINNSDILAKELIELIMERYFESSDSSSRHKLLVNLLLNCSGKMEHYVTVYFQERIEMSCTKHRKSEADKVYEEMMMLCKDVFECSVGLWTLLAEKHQSKHDFERELTARCTVGLFRLKGKGSLLFKKAPFLWNCWLREADDSSYAVKMIFCSNLKCILQEVAMSLKDESVSRAVEKVLYEEKTRETVLIQLKDFTEIPESLVKALSICCSDKRYEVRKESLNCCLKIFDESYSKQSTADIFVGMESSSLSLPGLFFRLLYTKEREHKNQFEEFIENSLFGNALDLERFDWIISKLTNAELAAFESLIASKASMLKFAQTLITLARLNMQSIESNEKVHFKTCKEKILQIATYYHIKFVQLPLESVMSSMQWLVQLIARKEYFSLNDLVCSKVDVPAEHSAFFNQLLSRIHSNIFNSELIMHLSKNCHIPNVPMCLNIVLQHLPQLSSECIDFITNEILNGNVMFLKCLKIILKSNKSIAVIKRNELIDKILSEVNTKDLSVNFKNLSFDFICLLDKERAMDLFSIQLHVFINDPTDVFSLALFCSISKYFAVELFKEMKEILTHIKKIAQGEEFKCCNSFCVHVFYLKFFYSFLKGLKKSSYFSTFFTPILKFTEKLITLIPNDNINLPWIYFYHAKLISLDNEKHHLMINFIKIIQNNTLALREKFFSLASKSILNGKISSYYMGIFFFSAVEPSQALKRKVEDFLQTCKAGMQFQMENLIEFLLIHLSLHPDSIERKSNHETINLYVAYLEYFLRIMADCRNISTVYLIAAKMKKYSFINYPKSDESLYILCDIVIRLILNEPKWQLKSILGSELLLEYERSGIIAISMKSSQEQNIPTDYVCNKRKKDD